MKTIFNIKLLITLVILTMGQLAQASKISLETSQPSVSIGQNISIGIYGNFGQIINGGIFSIGFDNFTNNNQLTFDSFTPSNLEISYEPDSVTDSSLEDILVGDETNGGLSANEDHLLGTLTFLAKKAGIFNLSIIAADFSDLLGESIELDLQGTSITVLPDNLPPVGTVPLPATFWLMLTPVLGLLSALRKKASHFTNQI